MRRHCRKSKKIRSSNGSASNMFNIHSFMSQPNGHFFDIRRLALITSMI